MSTSDIEDIEVETRIDTIAAPVSGMESVAVELRGVYSLRQQVEDELNGAVTTRLEAINQADLIVSQAQGLAKKMAEETRALVEKVLEAANAEANAIIARGREEAEKATADLANVIAAGEAARADAANTVDRARAEAEVIISRAQRDAGDIREKAVRLAVDNNRVMLDELERGAMGLRRAMESTFSSLDTVLQGVTASRSTVADGMAAAERQLPEVPLALKGDAVTKAFAKPARKPTAAANEDQAAAPSKETGRGWRKR